MKCPYCNEEIEINSKVCPVCGEKIPVFINFLEFIKPHKHKIIKSLAVIIIVAVSITLLSIGISSIGTALNKSVSSYKSIVMHEDIKAKDVKITGAEAINIINTQATDLLEFLKTKKSQKNKDNIFLTFYQNLSYYKDIIWSKTYEKANGENNKFLKGKTDTISGIQYKAVPDKYHGISIINIVSPEIKSIIYVDAGYGEFEPTINYSYLVDTYSKYLSDSWNEYFNNKKNEQNILKGRSYYIDGRIMAKPLDIVDWVIARQNFIKKYPDFPLNEEIQKDIKNFTGSIMYTLYVTFDYDYKTFEPDAKKAYEKFLSTVDKDSEEYAAIEKAYEIIKKHRNKSSDEFFMHYKDYMNIKESPRNYAYAM